MFWVCYTVKKYKEVKKYMSRNYDEIAKEILYNGFFSEYLPCCFSVPNNINKFLPGDSCDIIEPYSFTMSRYNGNDSRRTIFIPEIGSFLTACEHMKRNLIYQELIEFSESSKHSFSPILKEDNSIVKHEQVYGDDILDTRSYSADYINNIGRKIILAAGAKKILKLDISNCYSSFYMHMIPAILLNADNAEKEYNKSKHNVQNEPIDPIYIKYKKLDEIMRRQNLNRTNGLLTGPINSKIVVEAILTRIDSELDDLGFNFARYVDDYEFFIFEDGEEKNIITKFSNVLKRYGFSVNAEKTTLIDFPYYLVENFQKIIDSYPENFDDASLIDIFTAFSNLEKNGVKGAIRFLLKVFDKAPPKVENSDLYKAYLFNIMANNERSLIKACSILIDQYRDDLTDSDIKLIIKLLRNHLSAGHDLEVIWLLCILIELDKGVTEVAEPIAETDNELAQLLLLRTSNLKGDNLNLVIQKARSWILLYELYAGDYIDEETFISKLHLSKSLKMYQRLKNNGIHFIGAK